MSLLQYINEELDSKANEPEAVEDLLIKDSVLKIASADFTQENDIEFTPGLVRKSLGIDDDKKYKGKPTSRKRFFKSELKGQRAAEKELEDESNGSDTDDLSEDESDTELSSDLDESEASGSEDMQNESGASNSGEIESKAVPFYSAKAKDNLPDILKGKSIKNQLNIWESLLEWRIKVQPSLIAANKLYQGKDLINFKSKLDPVDENVVFKTYNSLHELMKNLLEIQELLLKETPEFDSEHGQEKMDSENESIASSEASGKEGSDEEVTVDKEETVDTDKDELKTEIPVQSKKKKLNNDLLDSIYNKVKPFVDTSIQKWYEKTKITSGKVNASDFSAFQHSTLKQIEQILLDKTRLIKKTKMRRSDYDILGLQRVVEQDDSDEDEPKKKKIKCYYNDEIFDDDDFYHKLLGDFIERKSYDGNNQLKHGRQWLELQKIRSKMKRKVDTKASKGRKLRFTVHNKLVNFMAPVPSNSWTDEAKNSLFNSLFGKANSATA